MCITMLYPRNMLYTIQLSHYNEPVLTFLSDRTLKTH